MRDATVFERHRIHDHDDHQGGLNDNMPFTNHPGPVARSRFIIR